MKTTDALRLEIHDLRDLAKGPTGFKSPEKSSQDGVQKQASWRQQLTVVDGVTVTARLTELIIKNTLVQNPMLWDLIL